MIAVLFFLRILFGKFITPVYWIMLCWAAAVTSYPDNNITQDLLYRLRKQIASTSFVYYETISHLM